ncbi:hypothetical protein niasHS_005803 [Heterodera schachtii]|uniref:Uncharacterized protein n=1 Tax=Heterodera schachtii TaxID=97005 RepID=A0ABD2JZG9_HETSC
MHLFQCLPFLLLFLPLFRHFLPVQFAVSFASDQFLSESSAEANKCEFSLQKVPGLSPLVKTDRNGRSCRGEVKLPFCRGLCKSKESGTHAFPHREQEAYFCGIVTDNAQMKNVTLDECEEGADEEARLVQISTATECKCIKMT